MRRRTLRVGLLAGAALAALVPLAGAHDFWLQPSTFAPKVGDDVALRLFVGHELRGEEFPRSAKHRERFEVLAPEGTLRVRGGRDQERPAGRVRFEAEGLHWVVYRSRDAVGEVAPPLFAQYLREEGNERLLDDWKARDPEQKTPVREAFSRAAKSLVLVGGAATGRDAKAPNFDRRADLVFEIVPEVNPLSLRPGDDLPVRVFWQGKPLSGQRVAAVGKDKDAATQARTDAEGRARLRLAGSGFWLVKSVHLERAGPEEDVSYRSVWASLTFEMP